MIFFYQSACAFRPKQKLAYGFWIIKLHVAAFQEPNNFVQKLYNSDTVRTFIMNVCTIYSV